MHARFCCLNTYLDFTHPLQIKLPPCPLSLSSHRLCPGQKRPTQWCFPLLDCIVSIFFLPWSTVFTSSFPPALLRGLRPSQASGAIKWVLLFNPLQCASKQGWIQTI